MSRAGDDAVGAPPSRAAARGTQRWGGAAPMSRAGDDAERSDGEERRQ